MIIDDLNLHASIFLILGVIAELSATLLVTIPLKNQFFTKSLKQFSMSLNALIGIVINPKSIKNEEYSEMLTWLSELASRDLNKQSFHDKKYKKVYLPVGVWFFILGAIYVIIGILFQYYF